MEDSLNLDMISTSKLLILYFLYLKKKRNKPDKRFFPESIILVLIFKDYKN